LGVLAALLLVALLYYNYRSKGKQAAGLTKAPAEAGSGSSSAALNAVRPAVLSGMMPFSQENPLLKGARARRELAHAQGVRVGRTGMAAGAGGTATGSDHPEAPPDSTSQRSSHEAGPGDESLEVQQESDAEAAEAVEVQGDVLVVRDEAEVKAQLAASPPPLLSPPSQLAMRTPLGAAPGATRLAAGSDTKLGALPAGVALRIPAAAAAAGSPLTSSSAQAATLPHAKLRRGVGLGGDTFMVSNPRLPSRAAQAAGLTFSLLNPMAAAAQVPSFPDSPQPGAPQHSSP